MNKNTRGNKPPLPNANFRGGSPSKTMTNFSSKQLTLTEKRSFFSKLNAASCTSMQDKNQIQYYEGISRKEAVKAMINQALSSAPLDDRKAPLPKAIKSTKASTLKREHTQTKIASILAKKMGLQYLKPAA